MMNESANKEQDTLDISIIIPVYNTEKYIIRCIESVFRQDIQNFEIVVIDDCSEDKSYNVLQLLKRTYTQIKLYRNNVNRGAGYTKNKGLRLSKGKYICFLDSDDFLADGALGNVYRLAEEMKCDDIYYNHMLFREEEIIDNKKQEIQIDGVYEKGIVFFEKMIDHRCVTVSACHHFIRKSCINSKVLFSENSINDDWKFTVMLYQNIGKMVTVKNKYYMYMQYRNGSITSKAKVKSLASETFFNAIDIYNSINPFNETYDRVRRKILFYMMILVQNQIAAQNVGWEKEDKQIKSYLEQFSDIATVYNKCKNYSQYGYIDWKIFDKIKKTTNVYVYGAGAYGIDIMRILHTNGVKIQAFIVSNGKKKKINGIWQYKIDSIELKKDSFVIVAVSEKYKEEVKHEIEKKGVIQYGCLLCDHKAMF